MREYPLTRFSEAFAITLVYLFFATFGAAVWKALGPSPKAGEKPAKIELYGLRFAYNLTQAMLCAWMSLEAAHQAFANDYSLACNKVNNKAPVMGTVLYVFYLSKILDFMDTFFIIVRRNFRQLSFLHVYHHSSIFLVYWFNCNLCFDGDVYFTIVANGFIHFVMYTYYFVSMHTRDIWWKKYLTQMQMIQFMCMCTQGIYLLYFNCQEVPITVTRTYVAYIITMFGLFLHFYIQSYNKKPVSVKKTQ